MTIKFVTVYEDADGNLQESPLALGYKDWPRTLTPDGEEIDPGDEGVLVRTIPENL